MLRTAAAIDFPLSMVTRRFKRCAARTNNVWHPGCTDGARTLSHFGGSLRSSDFAVPASSRLNPNILTFRRPPSETPAPTRAQSAVELTLFALFGVSLIVAAV